MILNTLGVSQMTSDGLTGWIDDQVPDDPGIPSESTGANENSELDIEKKWIQWTHVDPEQFRFFYDKYHDQIMRYMLVRVEDEELAGELAGEVFLQALDQLPRFRWQGYSFGAWLFHLARQVLGRHWRVDRSMIEDRFQQERNATMKPSLPDAVTQMRLDHDLLRRALGTLVPDRQEAFMLHYWMEMTVREIAVVMKISEALAKAHLRRGRRQLRRWLTENGMEYGMSVENLKN
jgi:RNA polymerase sigma-70 factor (ECF subfamily)